MGTGNLRGEILGYYNVLIIGEDLQPRGGELFIEKDNPKEGEAPSGRYEIFN